MKRSMKPKSAISQTSCKTQISCKSKHPFGGRVPLISHQATPSIPENHTSDDNAANADDINSVLPDEILEEILAKLSVTSITRVRVGTICNKWKEIARSTTFLNKFLDSPSRKSWYLALTSCLPCHGHVYDRALGKWCNFDMPYQILNWNYAVASSSGLICTILGTDFYVCNPITKLCRKLLDCPTIRPPWLSGLTMSVGRNSRSYTLALISSYKREDVYKLAIDVFMSDKLSWETHKEVIVQGSVTYPNCVIRDGVLYSVLQIEDSDNPPVLWAYNLTSPSDPPPLDDNLISFTCRLESSQVMNVKGKLVIAAAIEKQLGLGIIIWLLKDKELVEVATAPDECCSVWLRMIKTRNLPKFQSSGFEEIIYIWTRGMRNIVMFDMVSGQWSLARSPFVRANNFSGICFEPRFDTVP